MAPIIKEKYDFAIHVKSRPLKGLHFYIIYIDSYYTTSQLIMRAKLFGISILVFLFMAAKILSLVPEAESRKCLTRAQTKVLGFSFVLVLSNDPLYSEAMLDFNWV